LTQVWQTSQSLSNFLRTAQSLAEKIHTETSTRSISTNGFAESVIQVRFLHSSISLANRHNINDAERKGINNTFQRPEYRCHRTEENAFEKAGLADDDFQEFLVDNDELLYAGMLGK
jgi:hypothetical protein